MGKSKMAATSTIMHNEIDPKCQKYGIWYIKTHFFRVRECNSDIKNTIGWMVYKIAVVSCKQLFQTFMNANQHTGHFTGSNHEYTHFLSTLQWYTVLTGSTLIPSTYAICCDIDHKAPWRLENQYFCDGMTVFWLLTLGQPWICTFWAHCIGVL